MSNVGYGSSMFRLLSFIDLFDPSNRDNLDLNLKSGRRLLLQNRFGHWRCC
jgi:hypothetical protein